MQISLRETSKTGISLFLSIEGPLNLHFGHCVGRRPLQGGSYTSTAVSPIQQASTV